MGLVGGWRVEGRGFLCPSDPTFQYSHFCLSAIHPRFLKVFTLFCLKFAHVHFDRHDS